MAVCVPTATYLRCVTSRVLRILVGVTRSLRVLHRGRTHCRTWASGGILNSACGCVGATESTVLIPRPCDHWQREVGMQPEGFTTRVTVVDRRPPRHTRTIPNLAAQYRSMLYGTKSY